MIKQENRKNTLLALVVTGTSFCDLHIIIDSPDTRLAVISLIMMPLALEDMAATLSLRYFDQASFVPDLANLGDRVDVKDE
jgi:hypothetical protein